MVCPGNRATRRACAATAASYTFAPDHGYAGKRQSPSVDLQAAAAARLKFTPEQTMKLAQALFDHRLITYHRTDSVRMADEFITEIRDHLAKELGRNTFPRSRISTSRRFPDAHEGIRPTHMHGVSESFPVVLKEGLTNDHARLYELISRRAVGVPDAVLEAGARFPHGSTRRLRGKASTVMRRRMRRAASPPSPLPLSPGGEGISIDAGRKGSGGGAPAGKTEGAAPAGKSTKSGKAAAASAGSVGPCPVCGKDLQEFEKGYSCTARCGFVLWKNKLSRWGKEITPSLAARLLKGRPVQLRALVSAKEKKKFDAQGQLHNDPQYGWSVRLIFSDS